MRITVVDSHGEVRPTEKGLADLFVVEVDESGLERWYEVRNSANFVLVEFGADVETPVSSLLAKALVALDNRVVDWR